MYKRVSIPYRRNESQSLNPTIRWDKKFQFLIGAMKVSFPFSSIISLNSFQFLIGAMKGSLRLNSKHGIAMFQFLIGAMKVEIIFLFFCILSSVSIPYRRNERLIDCSHSSSSLSVSIPYRRNERLLSAF